MSEFKKCIRCNSDRIMFIQTHGKDLNYIEYPKINIEHYGYLPYIDDICDGDDATFSFCVECGTIQAKFPISDEIINQAFKEASGEDEDEVESVYTLQVIILNGETLLNDDEIVNIPSVSSLFKISFVKNINKSKDWYGWGLTDHPKNGRTLIALFCDGDGKVSFKSVAYIPENILKDFPTFSWDDLQ